MTDRVVVITLDAQRAIEAFERLHEAIRERLVVDAWELGPDAARWQP